ncbi:thiamine phosphate synthase [Paenalkalicoccus suaedae]|uniref:Thiamine phosphate synthase n=1 Tax=Paenalkalicoccus suaedae TaxID=2592382 RepID=A0A859FBY3_9BACI|nr:thiamine phosphate synthase [Paenalkalicoccus suaedae]QKS69795.1 thiamine phosphate synthase [Paenalkalicoccus suaedae]
MRLQVHVLSSGNGEIDAQTATKLAPRIDALHIREKRSSARDVYELGQQLVKAGFPKEKLVINDRVDVALALGAGGVHLGGLSLSPKIVKQLAPTLRVGRSIHDVSELTEVEDADYVFYGHIYATASKPGLLPRGIAALEEVVRASHLPVYAIGGVKPFHIEEIEATGAAGIAVLSGILGARDPIQATDEFTGRRLDAQL